MLSYSFLFTVAFLNKTRLERFDSRIVNGVQTSAYDHLNTLPFVTNFGGCTASLIGYGPEVGGVNNFGWVMTAEHCGCTMSEYSCSGMCGSSTSTCYCDEECKDYGDCCPDYCDECEPSNDDCVRMGASVVLGSRAQSGSGGYSFDVLEMWSDSPHDLCLLKINPISSDSSDLRMLIEEPTIPIRPIALGDKSEQAENTRILLSGFGVTHNSLTGMHHVVLPGCGTCPQGGGNYWCVGDTSNVNGEDSCFGDSGGPMVISKNPSCLSESFDVINDDSLENCNLNDLILVGATSYGYGVINGGCGEYGCYGKLSEIYKSFVLERASFIDFNLQGDVNEDGIVNILDIIQMVEYILKNVYNTNADVNNDNTVDIIDITLLVSTILRMKEDYNLEL